MKCVVCGNPKELKKTRIKMPYSDSGLDYVFLDGVIEYHCDECGSKYHSYGDLDQLHKLIADRLIRKKSLLTGAEIKFLRKYLGLNSRMFSKLLGVSITYYSKLENRTKDKISVQIDHLVRSMVVVKKVPDRNYDLHDQLIQDEGEDFEKLLIVSKRNGWSENSLSA